MQTPRPAYNQQLNQSGQSGQPMYAAQVPGHGTRHPSIYTSPAPQHQPSPPVSMTHPPNNVPSGTGPMIQNAQNQTGHSQFPHGPVSTRPPTYIQHQQQSGQPTRQIMHGSGNPGIAATTNFMNQNFPLNPQMAQYQTHQVLQLSNPNMGQFGSGHMMHGIMGHPSMPFAQVRQPFPNNPQLSYQPFVGYTPLHYGHQQMVAAQQQGVPSNQNQVANPQRPMPPPFSHQPASNPSGPQPRRSKQALPIIDPDTGRNILDDYSGPGSSSTSPSTASESASATVPTSNASTTGDSSKEQQEKTAPTSEEGPKDSIPQPQRQATPVTQSQPQSPQPQQKQHWQPPPPQQQQQQQQPPPPPQQQQQPQQQPPPHKGHQQQPAVVTSTAESKSSESAAKKSTSNVKNDATSDSNGSSSSSGAVGSSDIKPASETVVRPGPPQTESTPTITTESKRESVIESVATPAVISSENETPKDKERSKKGGESSEVSKAGVTKYSPSTDKASPAKVVAPVPVVVESSGPPAQREDTVDDVQKKLAEVNLNGDIDPVESDALSPPTNDASKSESDSKSLKSQSPVQASDAASGGPIDGDDKMQYNVNGKYQYTREQLFKLKESPSCQEAPKLAPNIWETLRAKTSTTRVDYNADVFYPFSSSSNVPRNPMPPRTGAYIGRCSLDSRIATKKVIPAPPLPQDVKLHTTENAWKPELKKKSASELDDEAKTAELLKTFRGYLNKITPQKYDVIEGKIQSLTIDTEERLTLILNLIFDKAVDEPAFCIQYANLCKYLNALKVYKTNEKGETETVGFWRLLLTKCQQQFERDIYADIDMDGKMKAIDECTDADKKRLLEAEFDEEKRRARKKSLGNMKLIGELYRLDMLNVKIMISCVQRLLSPIEEENIECLCTLLRTIGPKLSEDCRQKEKDTALDMLFNQLTSIANDIKNKKGEPAKLSSRVRFLILDILDMRKNNWQERSIQKEDRPKTIQEIHAEVQAQEEKQQMEHLQYSQNRERRKNHSDSSYARKSQQGPSRQETSKDALANVITIFQQQKQSEVKTQPLGTSSGFSKWSQGSGAHNQGNGASATATAASSASSSISRPSQEQKDDSVSKTDAGEKKNPEGSA